MQNFWYYIYDSEITYTILWKLKLTKVEMKKIEQFYKTQPCFTDVINNEGLLDKLKKSSEQWEAIQWCSCFKTIILHSVKYFASIPVAHATNTKEIYKNMKISWF